MELYRKELKLAVIKGLDESRGSSNVPIKLTHDTSDEYINYTEQIHIRYLFDNQVKEEILPTNDNGFYIPGKPLSHDGPIELAVHLINGNIELVTNELSFVVKNAPNGTTQVDPSEFTWQQLVDQYVNAKLDTFANKLDLSKFEETVNGSIENQSQNIESFKTEVNANLSNQDKKITDLQNTTKVSLDSQNTKIDNFKSEVNTSLSNQNTSINQTTSAQNSKITTLESRMDTFTRLSEGSTTGDAELQDIRVGANGITYDTAGNAVRCQYSQLKEDLDSIDSTCDTLSDDLEAVKNSLKFNYAREGIKIIRLYGDTNGMSKKTSKTLNYVLSSNKDGTCSVKWQGSSSLKYPKKNYTITFDTEYDFSNWGMHKKYVLKANWIDYSHVRNVVSAKLWAEIFRTRDIEYSSIVDFESNEISDFDGNLLVSSNNPISYAPNFGAIDGIPCLLVINDVYQGLYTLTIPKDAWLFNMGNNDNEAIVSAEGVDYYASQFQRLTEPIENETGFSLEYAKNKDDISWITSSINRAISSVLNNINNPNFENIVGQYIDIDSAIDYFIFSCLLNNVDGVGRNYILATYDGVKWYFSAYDLDSTFGIKPDGKGYYGVRERLSFEKFRSHFMMRLIYDYLPNRLVARYKYLRNTALSEDNVLTLFNNYLYLIPKIYFDEELKLWDIPSSQTNNMSQIMQFYTLRCKWLDKEIEEIEKTL